MVLQKDEILDRLASVGNVAQFIAFRQIDGVLSQSFSRVAGMVENHRFESLDQAVTVLLSNSSEHQINIRSFDPDLPQGNEFIYGVNTKMAAIVHAQRLAADGLNVIFNETIDIRDGGVSGVVDREVIEFAPDDTPRCVERPGVASFPRTLGIRLLSTVYGFVPDFPDETSRIEFSIHPQPRGTRKTHTILWEIEADSPNRAIPTPRWPNRFSRHIGDKTYGLLVSDLVGQPVPETLVIGRRVGPFQFGSSTGSMEKWVRTSPIDQQPGLFTTSRGWLDPFELLSREDPNGEFIASVLYQSAVPAFYAGAAIVLNDGKNLIEGRPGEGDGFMLGVDFPVNLPEKIYVDVNSRFNELVKIFGAVRFEWVHDGEVVWIVQLHIGSTQSNETCIVPGTADNWIEFDVSNGLEKLRGFLQKLPENTGVVLRGEFGLTSHIADVVRRAKRPAIQAPIARLDV